MTTQNFHANRDSLLMDICIDRILILQFKMASRFSAIVKILSIHGVILTQHSYCEART